MRDLFLATAQVKRTSYAADQASLSAIVFETLKGL